MSDSTANAREPSMEDILASIRRIIDEEDSRDARPATDLSLESDDVDHDVEAAAMPVMAPAPTNRDTDEISGESLESDTIFPERESPFWSRATGRDEEPVEEDSPAEEYAEADILQEQEDLSDADMSDEMAAAARTDIFTRAQNKLGSTARPSARERMQDLAARAKEAERAKEQIDHALDPADEPISEDFAEHGESYPAADDDHVLDLTDTVDLAEAEAPLSRGDDGETWHQEDGPGSLPEVSEHEETVSASDASQVDTPERDDVFDLITPIDDSATVDAGQVENGEAFHVSDVEVEEQPEEEDIEAAISKHLAEDGIEAETQDEAESRQADASLGMAAGAVAAVNTYSRFDREPSVADEAPVGAETGQSGDVAEPVEEAPAIADEVDYPAAEEAFEAASDSGFSTSDHGEPAAQEADDDMAVDAFSLHGEPDEDEIGDALGFTDTFGPSDVYHDDPPELDEDYSRSLEPDDDPESTQQAAFADAPPRQDDMETVGGMVREAMERDPVDYADPAALVSMTSEEISARALASLADVEGEASRRMYGALRISENGESDSLEGMVRGMLRPMLREWLDDNLPGMVESAVRGEVERISAKSRKYSRAADND